MAIDHIDKKVSIYNNEFMSALASASKTNEMPKTDEPEFKKQKNNLFKVIFFILQLHFLYLTIL